MQHLLCGISYRSIVIPRYQAGYLRVTHVHNSSQKSKLLFSVLLHVILGTPPAFVLSRDQTLIKGLSSLISVTDWFIVFIVQYYNLSCLIALQWFVLFSFQRSLCSLLKFDYVVMSQLLSHRLLSLETFLNFQSVAKYATYHGRTGIRANITAWKAVS